MSLPGARLHTVKVGGLAREDCRLKTVMMTQNVRRAETEHGLHSLKKGESECAVARKSGRKREKEREKKRHWEAE